MKFGVDEVLAVLNEAEKALSTTEVAQRCRLRRGLPERVAEPQEVRPALLTLEQQNLVVTAAGRDRGEHQHLVPFDDAKNRYWARPELSETLRAEREDLVVRHRHVAEFAAEFKKAWAVAGGPAHPERDTWSWPLTVVRPLTDQPSDRHPTAGVFLTAGQLEWLIGRLRHLPPA